MKTRFRIRETEKGFVAEEGIAVWSFWSGSRMKWSCAVCYFGTDEPYYFTTFESALRELQSEVRGAVRYQLVCGRN